MIQHLPTGSQMQTSALLALCPSFGSYCSSKIADSASRVTEAMAMDSSLKGEPAGEQPEREEPTAEQDEEGEARNFEFTFVDGGSELPAMVAADEIFCNGRMRPLCPILHEAVLPDNAIQDRDDDGLNSRNSRKRPSRRPLKKLMSEERDLFASGSSSEADELDRVAPEMYCAWTPKSSGASQIRSKSKSNSTHDSKRWKLKAMLSD
ncbi:hypothetical protein EUGRSUZ_K02843 [Eucalyptus grandis]|uniref:Uncharacterized protein n=2 Tax=Eucalyptus grandis TaxID=71139 RepID=A0ACC3IXK1_EUCGR|nr:hypothetical protein EUGRSUZ_K02843 [Eucalyptus grandis]